MYFTKEELETKTLSDLLRIYIQADKLSIEKNQIEYLKMVRDFILNNFTEKPIVKLQKAYAEVDAMNLPEKIKEKIKQVKHCVVNISDHLDPMHINSMATLRKIVEELMVLTETNIENFEALSEN